MNEATIEKYRNAYYRAGRLNVMTAEYPPEWDAQCVEDDFIEERSNEIYNELLGSPEVMAEMFYTAYSIDGDNKLMLEFCQRLAMMKTSVASVASTGRRLKSVLEGMMAAYAIQEAKSEWENM